MVATVVSSHPLAQVYSHQMDKIEVKLVRRIVCGHRQKSGEIANLLERFERVFDVPGIPMFDDVESCVVAHMLENIGQRPSSIRCSLGLRMVHQGIEITEVGAQQAEAFGSSFFAVELVCVAQMDQWMAHYRQPVIKVVY